MLKDHTLVLGDYEYQDFKVPNANRTSFAHELLSLCLDYQIEAIFPLRYEEQEPIKEAKILFQEYGISVLIPDKFNNLNKWTNLYSDLTVPNSTVTSYNELSKVFLNFGYPHSKLWIGRADNYGELIQVDDQIKTFNHVWNGVDSLSFTQIGKIFNHQEFYQLNVYQADEHLTKFDVLYFNDVLKSAQKIDDEFVKVIAQIFNELSLEGFFEIIMSSNKIVRIKSNTI